MEKIDNNCGEKGKRKKSYFLCGLILLALVLIVIGVLIRSAEPDVTREEVFDYSAHSELDFENLIYEAVDESDGLVGGD